MKVIWKPKYPLSMFLIAETDADRVLVAMIRKTQRIKFFGNAPQGIYEEARKISPEEPNERVARAMMGEDKKCDRHKTATKDGCAECLGIAAFRVVPEAIEGSPRYADDYEDRGGSIEPDGSDIPF